MSSNSTPRSLQILTLACLDTGEELFWRLVRHKRKWNGTCGALFTHYRTHEAIFFSLQIDTHDCAYATNTNTDLHNDVLAWTPIAMFMESSVKSHVQRTLLCSSLMNADYNWNTDYHKLWLQVFRQWYIIGSFACISYICIYYYWSWALTLV